VRDYLNIWEVNDQVALQIVDKIMRDKYFEVILKNVMGFVTSSNFPQAVVHVLKDKYNKELSDIKKKLINEG